MKRLFLLAALAIAPAVAFSQGSYLNILGIIRGDSLGAQFGKKVVPAGDVNGDTIPDFLVLATGSQKVYLFLSKKGGLDTLPDLVFDHKSQLEFLGDINGDSGLDFAMREAGQRYRFSTYFGGLCFDTLPDGLIKGDSSHTFDIFGKTVSSGKLSNVGDRQLATGYTIRGFDSLRFYIYNMIQDSIDSLAMWKLDFQAKPGVLIASIQILGDINGDGFADLAIGFPSGGGGVKGSVEIYLGAASFDILPDIILNPPSYLQPGLADAFGERLFPVGDLNDDGFADFVVGASRTPLLYFGGNPLDTLPLFVLDRIADHFVNGGDINHDGFNDLLVGRDEHPITGFAYVYYGGPAMDSVVDLFINEVDLPFPADGFGQTVAGVGDVDGNGSNDFIVGSRSSADDNSDRGYVWVFKGLLPSTGVGDEPHSLPRQFHLEQNYPNPFNSTTVISYTLSRRSSVYLELFNIAGQKIKTLTDQEQSAGTHKVSWDGKDSLGKPVSSGVYLYRLKVEEQVETKKMTLIR